VPPTRVLTFSEFSRKKTEEAARAALHPLTTLDVGHPPDPLQAIGSSWTRRFYDGDFHLFDAESGLPAVSLVFVQSRDGNTAASNPDELGGGPTDKHLIYEGLSRAAADAVLAGATTASGKSVFFSVWHPEIVQLRQSLGLPRHPAQVVLSQDGRFDPDAMLLFNVPDVRVFVIAGEQCRERCRRNCASRPWVTVLSLKPRGLPAALMSLRRDHGIHRISAVGGRGAATSLIDAGLVQDLCLTTAPRDGGEPDTPFYTGVRPPAFELVVRKREMDTTEPILFEHLRLTRVFDAGQPVSPPGPAGQQ